ncbi:hypothetical protein Z951_41140 [Streptomyces sp. PRh5]|nr:hypothetical protein Z951_41140 [Streptomyces sp. PRh5]
MGLGTSLARNSQAGWAAPGLLMLHRRLVRDYEHLPHSSESRVYWAMTAVILRRLTGVTAAAWRST